MPHDVALIALLAVGFGCATLGGLLTARIGLPPLVGYLLAGVAIGPFTPGFTGDAALAHQLAEIGVVLLMFGVGLHVAPADLLAVRRIAVPGALAGFALANALGIGVALAWGWGIGAGVVLGLALSVTSTVVLLRALEARGALADPIGRIAIGWLVVEDLLTVVLLVALPAVTTALRQPVIDLGAISLSLILTLLKLALFVIFMLTIGARVLRWVLDRARDTGARELFTLAMTAIAIGVGFGCSEVLGLSHALGAFFAGVVVNGSDHSHRAVRDTEPLQDLFTVLFFVSVGMLFNPVVLVRQPLAIATLLAVILLGKPLVAGVLLRLSGLALPAAATLAVGLAQIGEFSFILVALGVSLDLLPQLGQDLVLATALLAITLNPLLFGLADRLLRGRSGEPGQAATSC
jgi:CPA2 family monovalent cation:H+ antiporter-2